MLSRPCPIHRATPRDNHQYWFGYYDKNPWSVDNSLLLTHRTTFCNRFPRPGESAEIGWIEDWHTNAPRFIKLADTHAWNWQQGAMLRWTHFGASDPRARQRIMFNDSAPDGSLITRIINPDGSPFLTLPHPHVAVAHDCLLSLSFGRLSRLRPEYGYPIASDPHPDNPSPADDGIFRINPDGSRTLLISIDTLDRITADNSPRANTQLHQHVNHLMLNPSGTRFCFMHRFERDDGILHSRLFTADTQGRDIRLLFEGMCSHYDWQDDHTILAWAGKRSLLGSASARKSPKQQCMTLARRGLKPIYYALGKPRFLMNKIMKDSYLLIDDTDLRSPAAQPPQPFAAGQLICDGHCTFNRAGRDPGRWVLTDGYPDMKSRQPLFLWDCFNNTGYEIGRFHTPRSLDGDIRVDLHPRFNHDATKVCIDSAMDGSRAMYILDISAITNT